MEALNFKRRLRYFSFVLLGIALLEFPAIRTYQLINDKDFYGFPAKTQCRICSKTVWAWQDYERREFIVENTGNFSAIASASGLVHNHCKGNPVFKCNVNFKR